MKNIMDVLIYVEYATNDVSLKLKTYKGFQDKKFDFWDNPFNKMGNFEVNNFVNS